MSEFIKKRVLKDLISEIGDIDPTSLELVGHRVIELLEGQNLIHHGINKDHKPVGYTVDTFSHDFSIVGEYSTDEDYFVDASGAKNLGAFKKIQNDVEHSIKMADGAVPKIYLVSSREEPPSFRGKFNASALGKGYGKHLNILDARELAKSIFDYSVENPIQAEFFSYYFPDFAQNLDNYEYFGLIPPICVNHESEPQVREAIYQHFKAGSEICVLHGVSGSGKTQAAIDFVKTALPDYGNYIWVAGEDWKKDVPLSAVKRNRGGVAINVAGVFNSRKTLLVIDDLTRVADKDAFAELASGFARGSRVLITSQIGDPKNANYLPIPPMPVSTAFKILGEDEATTDDVTRHFVELCRFCPILLAITREISAEEGVVKGDLYREVLDDPNSATGHDGTSIMARILARLSEHNRKSLVKIANSGCGTYDSPFLTSFIGAGARSSLQRLSLLARNAATSTLGVHDLICSAVRDKAASPVELVQAVEQYVAKHKGEMLPSVLRQIHLCIEQLIEVDEERGVRRPDWLTYALLQRERREKQDTSHRFQDLEIEADMPLAEVLCIVDSNEAFSYTLSQEERPAYYEKCSGKYEAIAKATVDADIRAEMLHHQGKALRRCGDLEASLACFEALLNERPDWHATYGQIAHLGTTKGASEDQKEKGSAAVDHLISEILVDRELVPLRVSLAAISRLRSYRKIIDVIVADPRKVSCLAEVVVSSALDGLDQFYEGFLALTSLFGYRYPAICVAIAEAFPDLSAVFPNAIEERQWVNACEALTNISNSAASQGKGEVSRDLHPTIIAFAEVLREKFGDRPYNVRAVAKAFLEAERSGEALETIKQLPEESQDHWIWYQKAKAELALGAYSDALVTSIKALEAAKQDSKASSRLASYYDQFSQSLEATGAREDALEATRQALKLTSDPKYQERLRLRIQALEVK